VARVLIVGCGCRGQALAASLSDHAVRGTSRSPERVAELGAAGIDGVVADPDRLGTLVPALAGVSVVCWLMGTAAGSPELHGERLQTFVEHLVDTPVRGLVYEAAGTVAPELLEQGTEIVLGASRLWHVRGEVVSADPAAFADWLEAMTAAVGRILSA
jgi:uncharacterized protein YbjT (DUF2867 family)